MKEAINSMFYIPPQSVKLTTKKHQRNQKCNPEAEAS